jgi:hypothetical protein
MGQLSTDETRITRWRLAFLAEYQATLDRVRSVGGAMSSLYLPLDADDHLDLLFAAPFGQLELEDMARCCSIRGGRACTNRRGGISSHGSSWATSYTYGTSSSRSLSMVPGAGRTFLGSHGIRRQETRLSRPYPLGGHWPPYELHACPADRCKVTFYQCLLGCNSNP